MPVLFPGPVKAGVGPEASDFPRRAVPGLRVEREKEAVEILVAPRSAAWRETSVRGSGLAAKRSWPPPD